MRRFAAIVSVLAVTVSCAKRPDAIAPVDIPLAAYSNQSCPSLSRQLVTERGKLAAVSEQQTSAANGDAMGVFLIGVPASSAFGGDKAGEVGVAKGKVLAVENAMKAKGCKP